MTTLHLFSTGSSRRRSATRRAPGRPGSRRPHLESPPPARLRLVPAPDPGVVPGRRARRGRSQQPPLRLTRRGRIVVRVLLAVLFGIVVTTAALLIGGPVFAGAQPRPMPVGYRVVLPGETLLQIAAEVDPESDARDVARRIAGLNALGGWGLRAGQRLALPVDS